MTPPPGRYIFSPQSVPGDVGRARTGHTVRAVSLGDFYETRLWGCFSVVQVLMELTHGAMVAPDILVQADEQVAAAYWGRHGGILMPPRMVRRLKSLMARPPAGRRLAEWMDMWMESIGRGETLEGAYQAHAGARGEIVQAADLRQIPDEIVAAAEVTADVLLIQRAIAEDVRTAERMSVPGQPRGMVLTELDRQDALVFERAMDHLLTPDALLQSLSPDTRPAAQRYAAVRGTWATDGVFNAR
jgi:hypothetical protein